MSETERPMYQSKSAQIKNFKLKILKLPLKATKVFVPVSIYKVLKQREICQH